jgi:CheY-like chemotaxis protein
LHAFIIEDDYLISQTIQDLLGPLGFSRFSFARSEDTAIAGATGEKFDLITADSRLLPGDGVRAVETIRDRLPGRCRRTLAGPAVRCRRDPQADRRSGIRQGREGGHRPAGRPLSAGQPGVSPSR